MAENRKKPAGTSGNRPFSRLGSLLREAGIGTPGEPPRQLSIAPPEASSTADDEAALFERAMEGIERMRWRHDPALPLEPQAVGHGDQASEDERLFQEALGDRAVPPIPDHPEYIEGWIGIAGRRFLPNLRNGVYSIQGQIDLHGLGRDEARGAVEEFIEGMSRGRSCCVKVICGRGINSAGDTGVLKEHLQRWLASRRMSRHVVAYASAPYADGGVGAVYVLLRRMPSK